MHDEILPTPLGLLRCLQALAEEAASLRLTRTLSALQHAIETCRAESALRCGRAARRLDLAGLN